eukprot:TRINITY_DN410_c0_g1_i2.p1 TRINITY_DN410_c0_g1~~TRINITY_DN410_c0_g1_i2.p1  ORF type:complete len:418 (-),score=24.74 TRINITY_DN410_c0_g1_i2:143-1396(-)
MPVGRRVSSKEAPGGPGAKKKKRGSGLQWTLAPNGTLDTAARPASKENAVPDFLQEAHIAFRQNNPANMTVENQGAFYTSNCAKKDSRYSFRTPVWHHWHLPPPVAKSTKASSAGAVAEARRQAACKYCFKLKVVLDEIGTSLMSNTGVKRHLNVECRVYAACLAAATAGHEARARAAVPWKPDELPQLRAVAIAGRSAQVDALRPSNLRHMTDDELKAAGDFLVEFADAPRGVGAAPAVEAEDVDSSDVEALPPPGRAAAARRAAAAAANAGGAAPPATAGQVAALEWQRYTALFGPHAPADTRYPGAVSYWTDPDVAGTFPTLCRAWKRLGSASPTQAICERCFSVAGCTLTAKRCSLNSETAATCVLARLETDMFFPKKGTPATSVEKWDSASVTSFLRESFRFEDVTSSDEEE